MEGHGIANGLDHLAVVAFVVHHDAVEVETILQIAHGAVGNINQGVHVVVAVRDGVPEHGDHLVRDAVDANTLAESILAGEKFLLHRGADDGHAGVGEVVAFAEE